MKENINLMPPETMIVDGRTWIRMVLGSGDSFVLPVNAMASFGGPYTDAGGEEYPGFFTIAGPGGTARIEMVYTPQEIMEALRLAVNQ